MPEKFLPQFCTERICERSIHARAWFQQMFRPDIWFTLVCETRMICLDIPLRSSSSRMFHDLRRFRRTKRFAWMCASVRLFARVVRLFYGRGAPICTQQPECPDVYFYSYMHIYVYIYALTLSCNSHATGFFNCKWIKERHSRVRARCFQVLSASSRTAARLSCRIVSSLRTCAN